MTARRWARRGATAAAGLAAVAALATAGLYAWVGSRLARRYEIAPRVPAAIAGDDAVARGQVVATRGMCTDCHAADLGGGVLVDDPLVARLGAPNLTAGRGGVGARFTDADFVRAIRHGVGADGRPLLLMPSHELGRMSDADLAALLAYLRSLPPVDRTVPERAVGPVGMAMVAAEGLLAAERIDHAEPAPEPPPAGPTREYGEHLARVSGCTSCHGADLAGGGHTNAANLTPAGIGDWTEADFVRAIRTGVRPDGRELRPTMPWPAFHSFDDDDLRAIWLYLRSVPPKGGPRT